MRRMINYLKSWFVASKVSRQLMDSDRRLKLLDLACAATALQFHRHQKNFDKTYERATEEIERSSVLIKQFEEALAKERAANRVHEKTIEGLVAQNDTFVKTWETQSAIEVMRRVGAKPRDLRDDIL